MNETSEERCYYKIIYTDLRRFVLLFAKHGVTLVALTLKYRYYRARFVILMLITDAISVKR